MNGLICPACKQYVGEYIGPGLHYYNHLQECGIYGNSNNWSCVCGKPMAMFNSSDHAKHFADECPVDWAKIAVTKTLEQM